jgi:hypothetical protein
MLYVIYAPFVWFEIHLVVRSPFETATDEKEGEKETRPSRKENEPVETPQCDDVGTSSTAAVGAAGEFQILYVFPSFDLLETF